MDVVYIVLRNSIDWSGPPPTFAGIGLSVREALTMACFGPQYIEDWIAEKDLEVRAYFDVRAYDMTTTPPRLMDRPDLKRGGGPVIKP
jgi:hypothetical protein